MILRHVHVQALHTYTVFVLVCVKAYTQYRHCHSEAEYEQFLMGQD